MAAAENGAPGIIDIVGANYDGHWDHTRTACRAVILQDGKLLLSYETKTDQWMLPGGGLEDGESEEACCAREVAEETGYVIRPSACALEIDEYYQDWKWVNRYFFGTVTGRCETRLTDREKEVGMEPRWLPLKEIVGIFSRHADWTDTDEMRRGMYLREYTALTALWDRLPAAGSPLTDPGRLEKQYGTADRLSTRISIHDKYSVNKQGFGNWIAGHYPDREGLAVLELGCGTGSMWLGRKDLVRRWGRLVLTDLSGGMLDTARKNLRDMPEIEYRAVDIQDIPFPDGSFDLVIANMMLYHVPDLPRGLREVRRVLKQGGVFCCATYGENGIMAHIHGLFGLQPPRDQGGFTLQNGAEKLRPFFSDVEKRLYEDALEVTDPEDLVDYIFSLSGMTELQGLPRSEVRAVLERNMRDGVLRVPKEYGMFIAR